MTWDIPEQDLDYSSECLPERWGRRPLRLLAHRWSAYAMSDDFVATPPSKH